MCYKHVMVGDVLSYGSQGKQTKILFCQHYVTEFS